jgi:cell division protein FtsL
MEAGRMIWPGLLSERVRGFRIVDLLALAIVLVLAFGVYAVKTLAGAQSADAADVQRQIVQEERRVRLLKAEIAHLDDPSRIERLSTQYLGMAPVDPKRDASPDALALIAAGGSKP